MNKTNKVYLCHKCSGALTGTGHGLVGCGCMSGWVRDWQSPTDIDEARLIQAVQAESNLAFILNRDGPDSPLVPIYQKRVNDFLASI